jgi:hypothetical protein
VLLNSWFGFLHLQQAYRQKQLKVDTFANTSLTNVRSNEAPSNLHATLVTLNEDYLRLTEFLDALYSSRGEKTTLLFRECLKNDRHSAGSTRTGNRKFTMDERGTPTLTRLPQLYIDFHPAQHAAKNGPERV